MPVMGTTTPTTVLSLDCSLVELPIAAALWLAEPVTTSGPLPLAVPCRLTFVVQLPLPKSLDVALAWNVFVAFGPALTVPEVWLSAASSQVLVPRRESLELDVPTSDAFPLSSTAVLPLAV